MRRLDLVADKTYGANQKATDISNKIDNVLKPRLMQLENFNFNATITANKSEKSFYCFLAVCSVCLWLLCT